MTYSFYNGSASGWPSQVVIYTDGASRGNPGPASLGFVINNSSGEMVYEYGETLGDHTNNYAEYFAVLRALEMAVKNSVQKVEVRSDSQLLIRQLSGEYKVKSPNIKELFLECRKYLRQISESVLTHVPRELNTRADELANQALNQSI